MGAKQIDWSAGPQGLKPVAWREF